MDNISNLRKNIYSLEAQRKKIVEYLLNPRDMIDGSIYTVYKKCGNKNCRCTKGSLHGPFKYLSKKTGGVTKLTFIRRADEPDIEKMATNYRKYITHNIVCILYYYIPYFFKKYNLFKISCYFFFLLKD